SPMAQALGRLFDASAAAATSLAPLVRLAGVRGALLVLIAVAVAAAVAPFSQRGTQKFALVFPTSHPLPCRGFRDHGYLVVDLCPILSQDHEHTSSLIRRSTRSWPSRMASRCCERRGLVDGVGAAPGVGRFLARKSSDRRLPLEADDA